MKLFYDETEAYGTMLVISQFYSSTCFVTEWADSALIVAKSPTGKVYGIRVPSDIHDPNCKDYEWYHEAS